MSKKLADMTFDEMVNKNLAYMIQELCAGTAWRSIVFAVMDRTMIWRDSHNLAKPALAEAEGNN